MDTTATTVPMAPMVLRVGTLLIEEIPEILVAVEEEVEAAAAVEEEATVVAWAAVIQIVGSVTYQTAATTAKSNHLAFAGYKLSDHSTALPIGTSAHQIAWTIFCVVRPLSQSRDFVDFGISLKRRLLERRLLASFSFSLR
ncbi:hypothetical protein GALMADRAFT_1030250 [Galerina marginata CBS 339.88]|uniref:Uncharacterized protein n=1 Tax=Galerina marginata (strain CBS 339.88) TaxID=685588 RepID=A0A067SM35_GALM3|nr:hypothetical protein GALMADRAFT_1030250 [Galerina marginata CBS 339.88]